MYPNEYEEFVKLMTDLCISTNRPCNNDLIRVFWDDLKHVPFAAVQRQAAALRAKGQTKFNSNDLRPPAEERSPMMGAQDNVEIMSRLYDHSNRQHWLSLTPWQRIKPRTFIFAGDRNAPRCVAMRIDADGDSPGYLIRIEDCVLDQTYTRDNVPIKNRADWNDADAARDLLSRQS